MQDITIIPGKTHTSKLKINLFYIQEDLFCISKDWVNTKISIMAIDKSYLRCWGKFISNFLFLFIITSTVTSQTKIELTEFKSSKTSDKDFFCEKIKNCKDVESAYNSIVDYFILSNGDYFRLMCFKGCNPPLRKEFGKQPIPTKFGLTNPGAGIGYFYKPKLIMFIDTPMKDISTWQSSKNLEYVINFSIQKGNDYRFSQAFYELEWRNSHINEYLMPGANKDSLGNTYLFVLDTYEYTESRLGRSSGVFTNVNRFDTIGKLKYTAKLINPVSLEIIFQKDFKVQATKRSSEKNRGVIPNLKYTTASQVNNATSEKAAKEIFQFLDSSYMKLEAELNEIQATETNAEYITIQVDSLLIPATDLIGTIQNIQPVTHVIQLDKTRYLIKSFCTTNYIIEQLNNTDLKNYYECKPNFSKELILLRKKQ